MTGLQALPSPSSARRLRPGKSAGTAFMNRLPKGALERFRGTGFVAIAAEVEYDDRATGAVAVANRRTAAATSSAN
jgi:hypothetical protein